MDERSNKRKRKKHSVDEEELLNSLRKKVKRTKNEQTKEFVNRKERAHSLSSSDSDYNKKSPSISSSAEKPVKGNYHINKPNHLLTINEEYSKRMSNSSKKHKSPKKSMHVINEFNHLLSSDESLNSTSKMSANNVVHTKSEFNHPLTSNKDISTPNKFERVKKELNHLLSSDESYSKSSLGFKAVKTDSKQAVKLSDSDSQIVATDQNNEGDSSEDKQKSQNNNIGTQVQKKRASSADYEAEISKYSSLLDEELAEKYNIWILQCPNSLDCADLVGQSLDLTGNDSARLKVGNSVFEAYSYIDHTNRSATLAVPTSSNQLHVCKIPVTGNVIIEESVGITINKSCSVPDPPQIVELPQNLRTRHPFLGLDYERKVSPSSFPKPQKSAKKKKHSESWNESSYSNDYEIKVSNSESRKSAKKKKHSESCNESSYSNDYEIKVSNSNSRKSAKKKKHSESWNESSYSNGVQEDTLVTPGEEIKVTKKKHKKKKYLDEEISLN